MRRKYKVYEVDASGSFHELDRLVGEIKAETPEEAIKNIWEEIIDNSKDYYKITSSKLNMETGKVEVTEREVKYKLTKEERKRNIPSTFYVKVGAKKIFANL